MPSKQLLEIIIKAQDQASAKANEVDKSLAKIGRTGTTATQSTNKFNDALLKANNSLGVVGNGAHQASNLLHQMKLDPNFGSTMDRAKLKVSQMGYDINSAKGKLMTFKTAGVDTFNNFREKVSNAGNSLKDKFGNAVKNVKTELSRLREETKRSTQGFSYLKEALFEIGSNIATDLIYKLVDAGKSSIESASKLDYFAGRLNMSGKQTKQFRSDLDELQQRFRKVDMTAVGASAEELSVKLGMGSDSLKEMSETLAVASSAFVAEGRTQEDAILAVSDAIDGQWAKLKELGITQEDIKNNGWNGDLNDKKSLLEGLNNTLEKMGFTKTAEDIVTLQDALQALSVAGGILIQKVLVPLTPFLLRIMNVVLDMVYAIQGVIQYITNNGWLQGVLLITGLAIAFGLLAGAISIAEGGITAMVVGAMPSFIMSLYEAASGFLAISVAGAPLWLILGIIVAVAIAVYELGIAFGWWKDVGTMIDAITSGIGRLWAAFINNPNVKGFIKDLTNLWNDLCDALQPVVDWVKQVWAEMFPPGTNFDIVRTIINIFGEVGKTMGDVVNNIKTMYAKFGIIGAIIGIVEAPIMTIVGLFRKVICALIGCSPGIVPALQKVQSVFSAVWGAIAGFIGGVVSTIVTALQPVLDIIKMIAEFMVSQFLESWNTFVTIVTVVTNGINILIGIFNMFMTGQITLSGALSLIWTVIANMFRNILILIINRVRSFATNVIALALRTGRGFVTNIITFLITLPGRVLTILMNVARHVLTAGQQWIVNAHMKAMGMVTGVINGLTNLPSHMYNMLSSAVSEITKAGQEWIDEAKAKAGEIVTGVKDKLSGFAGAISGAMSGVKDAIVQPFQDAWNRVSQLASQIRNTSTRPSSTQGGYDLDVSKQINIANPGAYFGRSAVYEGRTDNLDVNINLSGVPSNMSERQLVNLLTSKGVIDALVNNNNFQSANRKATTRYNARLNRSG